MFPLYIIYEDFESKIKQGNYLLTTGVKLHQNK
jgi:hypothetical protein